MSLRTLALAAFAGIVATSAPAHEFWLEPLDYTLAPGQELQIEIRIGQEFHGNEYSYNPDTFFDYSLTDSTGKHKIKGRIGDRPSVQMVPENEGLQVINHFSTSMLLTYREPDLFTTFLHKKGLDWVLERHKERGLPDVGFSEAYTRFAKTLVAVGDGAGQDAPTGMPIELVALANPYTDDLPDGLPVRLIWQGEPLPDIRVTIFRKDSHDAEAAISHTTTDENGIATIPVDQSGQYLLNAVHMIIPSPADIERTGAVWHSLWASMTFEIGSR